MKLTDKEIETALKEGKRVRRMSWLKSMWIELYLYDDIKDEDDCIIDDQRECVSLRYSEIIADDWEIVEDKITAIDWDVIKNETDR